MNIVSQFLPWIQVILSVVLVILILFQRSESALGSAFGGGDSGDSVKRVKRGAEKWIFNATIIIGILFALSALLALFV